jgi:hypothetical protein
MRATVSSTDSAVSILRDIAAKDHERSLTLTFGAAEQPGLNMLSNDATSWDENVDTLCSFIAGNREGTKLGTRTGVTRVPSLFSPGGRGRSDTFGNNPTSAARAGVKHHRIEAYGQ